MRVCTNSPPGSADAIPAPASPAHLGNLVVDDLPMSYRDQLSDSLALPTARGRPRKLEPRFDPESKRDRVLWRRRIERSGRPLCVSLWSGAGGLDLGLEQAGFDVAVAADNDDWACSTHGHNSDALVFARDLDDPDLTRAWLRSLELPQVSLVAGGFPCQPYSRAGQSRIRHLVANRGRSAVDQRAFAWRTFVAAVDELRPDQAIAENVPDMARYNDGQLLRDSTRSRLARRPSDGRSRASTRVRRVPSTRAGKASSRSSTTTPR